MEIQINSDITGNKITKNILSIDEIDNKNEHHRWLSSLTCKRSKFNKIKELSTTVPKENCIYHNGLIQMAFYCWAKELSMVLRPDIIWYTIISEIARDVIKSPKNYKHLFTDSEQKKNLVTISIDIDMNQLMSLLKDRISNKEFYSLICETTFEEQHDLSQLAFKMVFANMATPYFNYCTAMCGVQDIEFKSSIEQWKKLYSCVNELKKFIPDKYTSNVCNVINNILYFNFNKKIEEDNKTFVYLGTDKQNFIKNVFSYGKEKCGSGHDDISVHGWLKLLYICNKFKSIDRYSTHINYVPYKNLETGRMFYKAVGLMYYTLVNGKMDPQYSDLFRLLAN